MRFPRIRKSQWFLKSEPAAFALTANSRPCPACTEMSTHESDYPSRVRPFSTQRVDYCARCGLGFVAGMGSDLATYYEQDYALKNRGDRLDPPEEYFSSIDGEVNERIYTYARRSWRQLRLLSEFGANLGSVLDYGSGPGVLLYLSQGRDLHAVEPDRFSHKYLNHLGATVHTSLETVPLGHFSAIVASHAIEHLPAEELSQTIGTLIDALLPSGKLLIEVPQGGHSYLHLAGERQDPHTLFFTGRALVETVQRAGGKVLFQQALGRVESPRRSDPIYRPSNIPFFKTLRGSLTVICTRA